MTKEYIIPSRTDVLSMAREADLIYWRPNSTFSDGVWWMDAGEPGDELERFAALVAAASASVEREACAKVCEQLYKDVCADAIRARGETSSRSQP